jgi:hypothetical protein
MSRLRDNAAGYPGVDGFFTPPQLSGAVVLNYHNCALTPTLARSDFLSDTDLACGDRVIFGREQELEFFGYDTDNNEDPPISFGPRVAVDSLTICQRNKFQIKLDELDERLMCSNYERWVQMLTRQIDKQIVDKIDNYSIPLILASAHGDNVGRNAGMLNHTVNLGGQGGSGNEPLQVQNIDQFTEMMDNFIEVSSQAGWFCDARETNNLGEGVANPVLVLPSKLRGLAKAYLRANEGGCCGTSAGTFRTGQIGVIDGIDIIVTQRLQPFSISGGGTLATPFLVDPNQILHAFDIISNKIYEGKFEKYFTGHFIYDTYVVNPYGVVVANVAL